MITNDCRTWNRTIFCWWSSQKRVFTNASGTRPCLIYRSTETKWKCSDWRDFETKVNGNCLKPVKKINFNLAPKVFQFIGHQTQINDSCCFILCRISPQFTVVNCLFYYRFLIKTCSLWLKLVFWKYKRLGQMVRVFDSSPRGPWFETHESQTLIRIFDGFSRITS